jgi:hypothetical protein
MNYWMNFIFSLCVRFEIFFPSSMHHICIILWVISCSILLWLPSLFLTHDNLHWYSHVKGKKGKIFWETQYVMSFAIDDGHGTRKCSHTVSFVRWYCSWLHIAFNYLLWDNFLFYPNSIDWIPWFCKNEFFIMNYSFLLWTKNGIKMHLTGSFTFHLKTKSERNSKE